MDFSDLDLQITQHHLRYAYWIKWSPTTVQIQEREMRPLDEGQDHATEEHVGWEILL
jgi:hypothetical protein